MQSLVRAVKVYLCTSRRQITTNKEGADMWLNQAEDAAACCLVHCPMIVKFDV